MEIAKRAVRKYRKNLNPPYRKKDIPTILGTLFILAAVPLTTLAVLNARDVTSRAESVSKPPVSRSDLVASDNEKLLNLLQNFRSNSVEMDSIVKIAKDRKEKMLILAEEKPKEFLNNAFSGKILKEFPKEITPYIESPISIKGEFMAITEDDFEKKSVRESFVLKANGNFYNLHFAAGEPPQEFSNVEVHGVKLGDKIVLEGTGEDSINLINKKVLAETTVKKIAVIMINFQDDTSQSFTSDQVRNVVFTGEQSAADYYQENSLNTVRLEGNLRADGDIFGWYTLPFSKTSCGIQKKLEWVKAANKAAESAGYIQSSYRTTIYAANTTSCGGGLAIIGGPYVWTGGYHILRPRTVIHELGHSFGVGHAKSISCVDDSGQRVSIYHPSTNCTRRQYGDPFDVMGTANVGHMNNSHKKYLGYLKPENVLDVTESGMFSLVPIEAPSNRVMAIRIPYDYYINPGEDWPEGGVAMFYYLEYRQPIGWDNLIFDSSSPVANGVSIRAVATGNAGRKTSLIDATTDTSTYRDSAFAVGETFTDTIRGISVKTLRATNQGALVFIAFSKPKCIRSQPTYNITPSNQWVNPGGTATYKYTIKNNDPSSCGPSYYKIHSSLMVKGGQQIPPEYIIKLEPGETKTGTYKIKTSDITPDGTRKVEQQIINTTEFFTGPTSRNMQFASTNLSVYLIDDVPPTVKLNSPKDGQTFDGGVLLSASAEDNKGVKEIEFYINNLVSVTISSCYDQPTCSKSYTKYLAPGNHTVKARALDKKGNSADSKTVKIRVDGDTPPPTVNIKANNSNGPITISYNTSAKLTWTSSNANSCYASQDWFDTKPVKGRESTGRLKERKTYTLTCTGPGGTRKDSVVVKVKAPPTGTPQGKLGDLNGDGRVNIFDLSILLTRYKTTSKLADLNRSGRVDIYDLSVLLSRWGI